MKDELGRKVMIKFVALIAKTYSYLKDDDSENKKNKRHQKVCHKKKTSIGKLQKLLRSNST